MKNDDTDRAFRDAERLRRTVYRVLFSNAQRLQSQEGAAKSKSVAQVLAERLALDSMEGDLKAIGQLMELSGTDFRSRDSQEKHCLDREKLNPAGLAPARFVIEERRPEA